MTFLSGLILQRLVSWPGLFDQSALPALAGMSNFVYVALIVDLKGIGLIMAAMAGSARFLGC